MREEEGARIYANVAAMRAGRGGEEGGGVKCGPVLP
jgi:hypothetical protein